MSHIDDFVKHLERAKSLFNAHEAELDEIRNKQAELKAMIAEAKAKLDNWEALAPADGIAAAMADRQSSRELAHQVEDARDLLKALRIDDECHWLDLANARATLVNTGNELRFEYKRLVSTEINGRLEKVADKLRSHVGGLAELAAIKKIAGGEEDAIAWAQAEFMKLLKPAMDSVDVNSVGIRMDIAAVMNEKVTTKYHHEIKRASSPGYRHKVNVMKNRK
ncbi:hypothetical protein D6R50_11060 [Aeromonas veronii]|uniref:Uncharacterized protein n=1 Tax=Aeromonas veronii TaxID=654 RepID=A0A3A9ILW0_AERVE|nr:hypothetical protein [Aeromonas veronii]RKJ89768.1 hypothetical protein D6R50_11060 [Aeromonas veronii]